MRWLWGGALVALMNVGMLSPSYAIVCGPGTSPSVGLEITGAAGAACGASDFGNGNPVLNTGTDPIVPSGYAVLDTSNGGPNTVPLSITFTDVVFPGDANFWRTDGNFSFSNPTGYSQFALGFQFSTNRISLLDPKPDWFIVYLPGDTLGSGQFDADTIFPPSNFELPADALQYAVLYGRACSEAAPCEVVPNETPLPAAVWLLGSVLAGGAGVKRWRKRRAKRAALAAA
jgi:hypothetical protein